MTAPPSSGGTAFSVSRHQLLWHRKRRRCGRLGRHTRQTASTRARRRRAPRWRWCKRRLHTCLIHWGCECPLGIAKEIPMPQGMTFEHRSNIVVSDFHDRRSHLRGGLSVEMRDDLRRILHRSHHLRGHILHRTVHPLLVTEVKRIGDREPR